MNSEQTRRLLDEMPQLIWTASAQGEVLFANKRCVELTGVALAGKQSGGWTDSLHPEDKQRVFALWGQSMSTGERFECEYRLRNRDGEYHWYLGRAVPIRDEQGEILQWLGTATDIHAQKIVEQELEKSRETAELEREQLRMALDLSGMGTCDLDLRTGQIYWDAQHCQIFGYEPSDVAWNMDHFSARLHPDDRERILSDLRRCAEERASRYSGEWRLVIPGEPQVRWVRAIGRYHYAPGGEAVRLTGIVSDITKLVRARQDAEIANQAKTQFLANMSHEIRTPLGVMLGYTDLALEDSTLAEDTRKHLKAAKNNGEALKNLVGELLDLAKVESEAIELEDVPTCLPKLLDEVMTSLRMKAHEKSLKFVLCLAEVRETDVVTDPVRVRQVLTNLIGNAIKFTERGEVHVKVRQEDVPAQDKIRLVVVVSDSGIGVPVDQRERLFRPFSQADTSMTRRYGGTGLGLVISKQIAKVMGGDVRLVESREGEGSTFEFSFCVGKPPVVRGPAASVPRGLQPLALRGVRVLLVEDAEDNQDLLTLYLGRAGAVVDVASHGEEGVMKGTRGDYDVVLMDIQMPVVDGYEATRRLRQSGFTKPIVALTAHALKSERDRAMREGFNGYLTKPLDRGKLLTTVAELAAPNA